MSEYTDTVNDGIIKTYKVNEESEIISIVLSKSNHKVKLGNIYKMDVDGPGMLELKEGETVSVSRIYTDPGEYNISLKYSMQEGKEFHAIASGFDKAIDNGDIKLVNEN